MLVSPALQTPQPAEFHEELAARTVPGPRDRVPGGFLATPHAAPRSHPSPAPGRVPIPYNGFHMRLRLAVTVAVLAAVALGQQPQRQERLGGPPTCGTRVGGGRGGE